MSMFLLFLRIVRVVWKRNPFVHFVHSVTIIEKVSVKSVLKMDKKLVVCNAILMMKRNVFCVYLDIT